MPYSLRGNSVVRSDTDEVVKTHPTREKALKHLRALKANVEEGSPTVLGVLLEGFDQARHPRGFHGRWVGTSSGKVLRVFHGSSSLGDAKPGSSRDDLLRNVAGVVSSSGRGMRPADLTQLVNHAAGSPEPSPRVIPRGGNANELRGGIPTDRHGGFKVGDRVTYREPSIVNGKVEGHGPPQTRKVVGLQRNGYLRLRDSKSGTTVDVHHKHATYASASKADAVAGNRAGRRAAEQAAASGGPRAVQERINKASSTSAKLAEIPHDRNEYVVGGLKVRRGGFNGRLFVVTTYSGKGRQPHEATFADAAAAAAHIDSHATVREAERRPELLGSLLEAFGVAAPGETPAQSMAIGAKQTAQAKAELGSGKWNASKHPRARGGKFGYTTGGKRAKKGHAAQGNTLTVGTRGALVGSVQRLLGVPRDGVYGPQTRAAVMRFQTQHGLVVDGVVGRQTLAALRGVQGARKLKPGPIASRAARVVKPRAKKAHGAPMRFGGGTVV